MTTQEAIESFYSFATRAIRQQERTIDELFDEWRLKNSDPDEVADNVAAIQAAIDDLEAGDAGEDAAVVIRRIREEFELSDDQ